MITNFKTFLESNKDDFLDIFKIKNVDVLDFNKDFMFYRTLDIEQTQELLKIWSDIKLPIKHDNLLTLYFNKGFIFYFYITRDKKDTLFFETLVLDDAYVLESVMNGEGKHVKFIPENILNLVKQYFDTFEWEKENSESYN